MKRNWIPLGVAACILVAVFASAAATKTTRSSAALSPQSVLDWNTHTWTLVSQAQHPREVTPPATRNLFQAEGLLYVSYVQAAVYDAVVAIGGRYQPYGFSLFAPEGASVDAAVAQAAHDVLSYYLSPWLTAAQIAQLDQWLTDSLGAIPNGQAKTDGVSVGHAAALGIIAIRTNDGRDGAEGNFGTGPIAPGAWVLTPGPFTFAQTPWLGTMHPFMLESPSQFRPGPPPKLDSGKWAKDFNETKDYGGALGTGLRTSEQTATAWFWNANVVNQFNDALRGVVTQRDMDVVDAAWLLAMANMTVEDAAMACWDAKYTYLFWRPLTAIRNADIDGNPKTTADPTWAPLVTHPNHPEYPSAHGCATGALVEILADALRTEKIDLTIKGAESGAATLTTQRTFGTVKDVTDQIQDARVWAGFHYRFAVIEGLKLAKKVVNYDLERNFRPVKH
jgi:hypothetical protein